MNRVELFRLRAASFGIAAALLSIGPDLQRRFKFFIVLLEITTISEMFEVSYGVIILMIFGRKKRGIRFLSSFVYKCIGYKNLRRVINSMVAC